MPKRLLIIDDNENDYDKIKLMLDKINTDNEYTYFPGSKEDFLKIRSNFNMLDCPMTEIAGESSKYLSDLIKDADLLLLDYQLIEANSSFADRISTGIDLYIRLKLNTKALIYTRSTESEIAKIKQKVMDHGLSDRMIVIAKPSVPNEEATNYLRNNIECILKNQTN